MARKSIIIDKNDWQDLFSGFCDEAYANTRKRVNYQTFRRLKKGPLGQEVQITFNDDNVEVYDVNEVGTMWFDMFSGTKQDSSFGSYLFDFFQEELKNMHHEEEKKYDIWGLTSTASCSSACSANDKLATTTTWAGDPYCNYADSGTAVSTTYTTISDSNRERIEELEREVEKIRSDIGRKADIEQVDYYVDRIYGEIDNTRMYVDENSMRIDDLEYEEKKRQLKAEDTIKNPHPLQVQGTSSIPVSYFKADVASCEGSMNRKEKENMDTNKMFANFEFGPVDDRVKMSPYGMAIRNADGRYVSYDPKTANIVDVEVFNFDNHNLIYKMPVAVKDVAVGDTVIHMKKPMFVTSVTNGISVIDIFNGEMKTIMPATNMFGFNFVTKVVSLFNFTGANTPSAENPFGNILPFMLMGEGKNFKDILPMLMLTGNTGMFGNMAQNPLMLYALMGEDGAAFDPLLMMALAGSFNAPAAPTQHQCNCGQNHQ